MAFDVEKYLLQVIFMGALPFASCASISMDVF